MTVRSSQTEIEKLITRQQEGIMSEAFYEELAKTFLKRAGRFGLPSCPRPGSNRHVFKGQWILSPSRLPFRHSGKWSATPNVECKGIEKTRLIKFLP